MITPPPTFGCSALCTCSVVFTPILKHYLYGTSMCSCGDSIIQPSETCDSPGSNTCNTYCETVSGCGDGYMLGTEACDDGNIINGDGCSNTCTIEAGWTCLYNGFPGSVCQKCGNGIAEYPETCDDSNVHCNSTCDGSALGWYCYISNTQSTICNSYCGDGILTSNENCDDKNKDNGDGCD